LGYVIAPAVIIDGIRKVHDFLTVGAASPLQEAALVALQFDDDYYIRLRESYTEKKNFFLQGLASLGLIFTVPQGAYYVLVDISEFGAANDVEFCDWLACEVGVAAVPGSSFFREDVYHLIRFHFAKNLETLSEALKRLATLRSKAQLYTSWQRLL
jgi:aminotransferase